MAREISSSTEYVLDDFDEEFPELYNALYQNALSGRARQARKACELATLGRRLAAQPRFGGLRDPGRLVQRPSHAPEVAELTAALRTARRSAQLLRGEILGQTPQAKAAAVGSLDELTTLDGVSDEAQAVALPLIVGSSLAFSLLLLQVLTLHQVGN